MRETVRAVYENGALRLLRPIPWLVEHQEVEVVLEQKKKNEKEAKEKGWPPGYFERTCGALQASPLSRPPQGELDKRKDLRL